MRLELTAGRLFGLAGPLQKAPQPKQRSPARGGSGRASQQQGARGPVAQRPRHRRTPAPRFMSSWRFDDDRPVTCTLLRFGRVCPRVGSEWRASLQYPIAADPKISESQPVLSAERCNSRVSWEDPIVRASGDQAAVSLQLGVPKRHRRAFLLYQLEEPLALENFALLARKGALQSAPRGVRPGAEEGGQEEAAALRRGQSKLLSRKKKTKTPDARARAPPLGPLPPLGPCTPASCLPRASSKGQSHLEPLRRSANEVTGSAKTLEAREGFELVKLPLLLEGGGTLTYIWPMRGGAGGGTVTHFEPMRQEEGEAHGPARAARFECGTGGGAS